MASVAVGMVAENLCAQAASPFASASVSCGGVAEIFITDTSAKTCPIDPSSPIDIPTEPCEAPSVQPTASSQHPWAVSRSSSYSLHLLAPMDTSSAEPSSTVPPSPPSPPPPPETPSNGTFSIASWLQLGIPLLSVMAATSQTAAAIQTAPTMPKPDVTPEVAARAAAQLPAMLGPHGRMAALSSSRRPHKLAVYLWPAPHTVPRSSDTGAPSEAASDNAAAACGARGTVVLLHGHGACTGWEWLTTPKTPPMDNPLTSCTSLSSALPAGVTTGAATAVSAVAGTEVEKAVADSVLERWSSARSGWLPAVNEINLGDMSDAKLSKLSLPHVEDGRVHVEGCVEPRCTPAASGMLEVAIMGGSTTSLASCVEGGSSCAEGASLCGELCEDEPLLPALGVGAEAAAVCVVSTPGPDLDAVATRAPDVATDTAEADVAAAVAAAVEFVVAGNDKSTAADAATDATDAGAEKPKVEMGEPAYEGSWVEALNKAGFSVSGCQ